MTDQDKDGPMTAPHTTSEEMKDAPIPTAANPGGAEQTADEPSGVEEKTSDAAMANGGTGVVTDQEAG